jgi:hypothetical protein
VLEDAHASSRSAGKGFAPHLCSCASAWSFPDLAADGRCDDQADRLGGALLLIAPVAERCQLDVVGGLGGDLRA